MVEPGCFSPEELSFLAEISAKVRESGKEYDRICEKRLESAKHEASRLAVAIAALDGVCTVTHIGSSATGRNFRLDSDIDIAVSGGDILAAMAIADTSSFHVDVIDIDRVPAPLREAMLTEGVILYEKS